MSKKSLFEGYPFGEAKSLSVFPKDQRPAGQQIDQAIKEGSLASMHYLKQFFVALNEAEEQIKDIQTVYPFIPEDYGFKEQTAEGEEESQMSFTGKYISKDENIKLEKVHDHTWRIMIDSRAIPDPVNPGQELFIEANIDTLIHVESEQEMYLFFKVMGVTRSILPDMAQVEEGAECKGAVEIQLNNGANIQSEEEIRGNDGDGVPYDHVYLDQKKEEVKELEKNPEFEGIKTEIETYKEQK